MEISNSLSLLGNYSKFTNRDPNDVPFRDTAEESYAVMLRYEFKENALKGLFFTVNLNYLGRRPGDAASGLTDASTSTNVIPEEPTFWLPSRTLCNASVGYNWRKTWSIQIFVDNVFDTKYLAASLNRFLVYPGEGINLRGAVTYKF